MDSLLAKLCRRWQRHFAIWCTLPIHQDWFALLNYLWEKVWVLSYSGNCSRAWDHLWGLLMMFHGRGGNNLMESWCAMTIAATTWWPSLLDEVSAIRTHYQLRILLFTIGCQWRHNYLRARRDQRHCSIVLIVWNPQSFLLSTEFAKLIAKFVQTTWHEACKIELLLEVSCEYIDSRSRRFGRSKRSCCCYCIIFTSWSIVTSPLVELRSCLVLIQKAAACGRWLLILLQLLTIIDVVPVLKKASRSLLLPLIWIKICCGQYLLTILLRFRCRFHSRHPLWLLLLA